MTAILHNGRGEYPDALAAAERAREEGHLYVSMRVLPELIEAAAPAGQRPIRLAGPGRPGGPGRDRPAAARRPPSGRRRARRSRHDVAASRLPPAHRPGTSETPVKPGTPAST